MKILAIVIAVITILFLGDCIHYAYECSMWYEMSMVILSGIFAYWAIKEMVKPINEDEEDYYE